MIRYALKCSKGHQFESWFQSAAGFDGLVAAGFVACAVCGDGSVSKELMAPALRPARSEGGMVPAGTSLTLPNSEIEQALADLRRKVEENADYVGEDFARIAREIHEGAVPERAIWGEARAEEARSLMEDGVPVAPLPFLPTRKAH